MIKKIFIYLSTWLNDKHDFNLFFVKPRVLNIPITDNCNAKCVMCDVWVDQVSNEMTVNDYTAVLSDSVFNKVQHVGLSGGEPTLRNDLIDIVTSVVDSLPSLRSLSITSHGFQVERHKRYLPVISKLCSTKGIGFTLNISIDGIGVLHDEVRRVPRGFLKAKETIDYAKQDLKLNVQIQSTISSLNVFGVGHIRYFAEKNGLDVIFRVATEIERLENKSSVNNVMMNFNQKSYLADFLKDDRTKYSAKSISRRLYYKRMSDWLIFGGERNMPCYFQKQGLLISSKGDAYMCSVVEDKLGNILSESPHDTLSKNSVLQMKAETKTKTCPNCIHDQSGAWSPIDILNMKLRDHKGFQVFSKVLTAINFFTIFRLKTISFGKKQSVSVDINSDHKAFVIGCYGGEHVGDAAILGGVMLRLYKKYSCSKYIVASLRRDRTIRWVGALDNMHQVEVVDYVGKGNKLDEDVTLLVIAGGPLMDLPSLLMKHIFLIKKAFKRNIPIIIEGVGIGPFRFKMSERLVYKILQSADDVTVRTSKAKALCDENKIIVNVMQDPAFDYIEHLLETKNISLRCNRLKDFLENNGKIIALNIRPLWSRYAKKGLSDDYIKDVEDTLIQELISFINRLENEFTVVFYPMNADQYGFSDLDVAYKIKDHVSSDKFFIWEYEPDIDEVCYLLQHSTYSIAMRFHACIFSLGMKVKTLGIDYGVGKSSKVSELFIDQSQSKNVLKVETVNSEQLINFVQ